MFVVSYISNLSIILWITAAVLVIGGSVVALFNKRWIMGGLSPVAFLITFGIVAPWQHAYHEHFDSIKEAYEYDGQFVLSAVSVDESTLNAVLLQHIPDAMHLEFHDHTDTLLSGEDLHFTAYTPEASRDAAVSYDVEERTDKRFLLSLENPIEYDIF